MFLCLSAQFEEILEGGGDIREFRLQSDHDEFGMALHLIPLFPHPSHFTLVFQRRDLPIQSRDVLDKSGVDRRGKCLLDHAGQRVHFAHPIVEQRSALRQLRQFLHLRASLTQIVSDASATIDITVIPGYEKMITLPFD
jgi:hypothetical protein